MATALDKIRAAHHKAEELLQDASRQRYQQNNAELSRMRAAARHHLLEQLGLDDADMIVERSWHSPAFDDALAAVSDSAAAQMLCPLSIDAPPVLITDVVALTGLPGVEFTVEYTGTCEIAVDCLDEVELIARLLHGQKLIKQLTDIDVQLLAQH